MTAIITKDAVVVDGILLERGFFEVAKQLAALMGETVEEYCADSIKCNIQLDLSDHAALGEILARPLKEQIKE